MIEFDYPNGGRLPEGVYRVAFVSGPRRVVGRYGEQLEYTLRVVEVIRSAGGGGRVGSETRMWISPKSRRQIDAAAAAGLMVVEGGRVKAGEVGGLEVTVTVDANGRVRLL